MENPDGVDGAENYQPWSPRKRALASMIFVTLFVGAQFNPFSKTDETVPKACTALAWDTNVNTFQMPNLPLGAIMGHFPRISFACEVTIENRFEQLFPDARPGSTISMPTAIEENGQLFYDEALHT